MVAQKVEGETMREAKTLTADEIAAFRGRRSVFTAEEANRMFATIEQQRQQIEKMRVALMPVFGPGRIVEYDQRQKKMNIPASDFQTICEALAATEPKP